MTALTVLAPHESIKPDPRGCEQGLRAQMWTRTGPRGVRRASVAIGQRCAAFDLNLGQPEPSQLAAAEHRVGQCPAGFFGRETSLEFFAESADEGKFVDHGPDDCQQPHDRHRVGRPLLLQPAGHNAEDQDEREDDEQELRHIAATVDEVTSEPANRSAIAGGEVFFVAGVECFALPGAGHLAGGAFTLGLVLA